MVTLEVASLEMRLAEAGKARDHAWLALLRGQRRAAARWATRGLRRLLSLESPIGVPFWIR